MDEIRSEKEFNDLIEMSKRIPILIDFYADWCMPCRFLSPILEKISKKLEDRIKIIKVNVEDFPEISMIFDIHSVPTLVLIKNKEEIDRFIGAAPESKIIEWLRENKVI